MLLLGLVDIAAIEVEVVRVVAIAVGGSRPVVAVVSGIVDARVVTVVVSATEEIVSKIPTLKARFASIMALTIIQYIDQQDYLMISERGSLCLFYKFYL